MVKRKRECKKHARRDMIVTGLLVLCAIYCVIGTARQTETGRPFYIFGYRPIVILSGSMEPELQTGSIVLVRRTGDIKAQDVVFFIAEDKTPVVHRYIGQDRDGRYITKGDRNPREDYEHISRDQMEGKVVWKTNAFAPVIEGILQREHM